MKLIDIIQAKRVHVERFANRSGAAGEGVALADMANWIPRPKGEGLKVLLTALREAGVNIKGSSFDAISLPNENRVDFSDAAAVAAELPGMVFVEIKSANQSRVKPGFSGFFFALTESEIVAAEALGPRHRVAQYNKLTGEIQLTSVAAILARAKSSNWQVSVQLWRPRLQWPVVNPSSRGAAMNPTAEELLDQADACHDDEPPRAAELLRRLDLAALPPGRLPGVAFLLNHVLGEKLGAWPEAHGLFGTLLHAAGDKPPPVLWRQAAAAARLAGDEAAAARFCDALAAATGATAGQAREVIALTALMYRVPTLPAAGSAEAITQALRQFAAPPWQQATPLDAAVAACANNIASGLLDRSPAELQQHPALRSALEDTAQFAERIWLRAGNWVNHERAAYLRAMVGNALGEASQAREHALRGLALLDANDGDNTEPVDRAFLELERARACRDLALHEEAQASQDAADALAAAFNDAGLDEWFAKRRAELGTPPRRNG